MKEQKTKNKLLIITLLVISGCAHTAPVSQEQADRQWQALDSMRNSFHYKHAEEQTGSRSYYQQGPTQTRCTSETNAFGTVETECRSW